MTHYVSRGSRFVALSTVLFAGLTLGWPVRATCSFDRTPLPVTATYDIPSSGGAQWGGNGSDLSRGFNCNATAGDWGAAGDLPSSGQWVSAGGGWLTHPSAPGLRVFLAFGRKRAGEGTDLNWSALSSSLVTAESNVVPPDAVSKYRSYSLQVRVEFNPDLSRHYPATIALPTMRLVEQRNGAIVAFGPANVTLRFPQSTCSLSDMTPALADVDAGALGSVGATAMANAGFAVSQQCGGGIVRTILYTLTDGVSTGNATDQLAATSDSTAAGVRLQLLRNNQPTTMGTTWTQSSDAAAPTLGVRYLRTGTLGPGTLKSRAVLRVDYP